jgi:hypothetical protein
VKIDLPGEHSLTVVAPMSRDRQGAVAELSEIVR